MFSKGHKFKKPYFFEGSNPKMRNCTYNDALTDFNISLDDFAIQPPPPSTNLFGGRGWADLIGGLHPDCSPVNHKQKWGDNHPHSHEHHHETDSTLLTWKSGTWTTTPVVSKLPPGGPFAARLPFFFLATYSRNNIFHGPQGFFKKRNKKDNTERELTADNGVL